MIIERKEYPGKPGPKYGHAWAKHRLLGLIRKRLTGKFKKVWAVVEVEEFGKFLGISERHTRRLIAQMRKDWKCPLKFRTVRKGRVWEIVAALKSQLKYDEEPLHTDKKGRHRRVREVLTAKSIRPDNYIGLSFEERQQKKKTSRNDLLRRVSYAIARKLERSSLLKTFPLHAVKSRIHLMLRDFVPAGVAAQCWRAAERAFARRKECRNPVAYVMHLFKARAKRTSAAYREQHRTAERLAEMDRRPRMHATPNLLATFMAQMAAGPTPVAVRQPERVREDGPMMRGFLALMESK